MHQMFNVVRVLELVFIYLTRCLSLSPEIGGPYSVKDSTTIWLVDSESIFQVLGTYGSPSWLASCSTKYIKRLRWSDA